MVKPLNARSGSNQAVCGSVGEKQKVRTQPWVLAHSYHVSYERERGKKKNKAQKASASASDLLSDLPSRSCAAYSTTRLEVKAHQSKVKRITQKETGWEANTQSHRY